MLSFATYDFQQRRFEQPPLLTSRTQRFFPNENEFSLNVRRNPFQEYHEAIQFLQEKDFVMDYAMVGDVALE